MSSVCDMSISVTGALPPNLVASCELAAAGNGVSPTHGIHGSGSHTSCSLGRLLPINHGVLPLARTLEAISRPIAPVAPTIATLILESTNQISERLVALLRIRVLD